MQLKIGTTFKRNFTNQALLGIQGVYTDSDSTLWLRFCASEQKVVSLNTKTARAPLLKLNLTLNYSLNPRCLSSELDSLVSSLPFSHGNSSNVNFKKIYFLPTFILRNHVFKHDKPSQPLLTGCILL